MTRRDKFTDQKYCFSIEHGIVEFEGTGAEGYPYQIENGDDFNSDGKTYSCHAAASVYTLTEALEHRFITPEEFKEYSQKQAPKHELEFVTAGNWEYQFQITQRKPLHNVQVPLFQDLQKNKRYKITIEELV